MLTVTLGTHGAATIPHSIQGWGINYTCWCSRHPNFFFCFRRTQIKRGGVLGREPPGLCSCTCGVGRRDPPVIRAILGGGQGSVIISGAFNLTLKLCAAVCRDSAGVYSIICVVTGQ